MQPDDQNREEVHIGRGPRIRIGQVTIGLEGILGLVAIVIVGAVALSLIFTTGRDGKSSAPAPAANINPNPVAPTAMPTPESTATLTPEPPPTPTATSGSIAAVSTPAPVPTLTPMPTATPLSTPTLPQAPNSYLRLGALAKDASDFAEPILVLVAERVPDFEDDFATTKGTWQSSTYPPYKRGTMRIQDGVVRISDLVGGMEINGRAWAMSKDFVFEIDARLVKGDFSSIQKFFFHETGGYYFNIHMISRGQSWRLIKGTVGGGKVIGAGQGVSRVGEVSHYKAVVKGDQAVIYINKDAVVYLRDPDLDSSGLIHFGCLSITEAVCEFDNVKYWDLDNVPNFPGQLPPPTPTASPTPTPTPTPTPPLTGSYRGTVTNLATALSAPMELVLRQDGTRLLGTFQAYPPLAYQGLMEGTVSGLQVRLVHTGVYLSFPTTVVFEGSLSSDGKRLNGTYSVASTGEIGVWEVFRR